MSILVKTAGLTSSAVRYASCTRIQRGEEKTPVVGDADENGRELGDDHEGRGLGGGPVVPSREGDLLL